MAHSGSWALTEEISQLGHRPHAPALPHSIPPNFVLPLPKRHSTPPSTAATPPVPIIDLAHYQDTTSNQLHCACTDWGLFHVINHGVPHAVLEQLQTQIDQFLALPVAQRSPRFLGNRGQGYGTGFIRISTGVSEWRDCLRLFTFPVSSRDYDAWPLSPEFRKAIEDFSLETGKLQLKLIRCLSQNLGLRELRLEEIVGDMQQMILMNHYPPCPQPDLAAGIDQHTDVGAITCLWQQDDVVGLQVFHDGVWIPVKPVPSALIIVIGDQIQIASNGIYKSAVHRAVLNMTKRRVSVASFYQLRLEQVVAPAVELIDDEHPPLYQAARFADHHALRKPKVFMSPNF